MRDAPPRAGQQDRQEGSSPSCVWPDTTAGKISRDICLHAPAGAARGRCGSKPPRAQSSGRCIAASAMHSTFILAKETEKGIKREERKREDTHTHTLSLFALSHFLFLPLLHDFRACVLIAFFAADSESSCIASTTINVIRI